MSRKYRIVLLFGLVSLIGDVIYEGARGITPPFLESLGASALVVGAAMGLSEFIGLSLRLISGVVADYKRAYWPLYFAGYFLIISIPMMAFVNSWQLAILLIVVERVAKAIRSPARDTLLSMVSEKRGKVFGLHELLDQIGAVAGPAVLGWILLTRNDYKMAYSVLFVPYVLLVVAALLAYKGYDVDIPELKGRKVEWRSMPRNFLIYSLSVALNAAGLVHVSLLLYRVSGVMAGWAAAFTYVLVQLVDAISSPLVGHAYDRFGRSVLYVPFLLSPIPTALTLVGDIQNLLVASALYGLILGMQESVYRAAVGDLVGPELRGTAYGIFNTMYGLGFLISGVLFGMAIDLASTPLGIAASVILELMALILLHRSMT